MKVGIHEGKYDKPEEYFISSETNIYTLEDLVRILEPIDKNIRIQEETFDSSIYTDVSVGITTDGKSICIVSRVFYL